MSKIYCGVSIPGYNQKQFKDFLEDSYKLRDFLFVLPMMWFSIISFGTSIYNMNIEFIMSNHFINKAVISEDDISIKMIKAILHLLIHRQNFQELYRLN
jgi:hypothetical protein